MSSERNYDRRMQFSLKAMFVLLTALAVPLASFRFGSVFWFLVLLAETVGGIGVAAYRALAREKRWRVFHGVAAVIGAGGGVLTLLARHPWTGTLLLQSMWWGVTDYGRGLSWGHVGTFLASAHLASVYLIQAWIAALALGAYVELLCFVGRRLLRSR